MCGGEAGPTGPWECVREWLYARRMEGLGARSIFGKKKVRTIAFCGSGVSLIGVSWSE